MASFRERKEREHYERTGAWKSYNQIRKEGRAKKITSNSKDPRAEKPFSGLDGLKALQQKGKPKQEDINDAIAEAQPSSLALAQTIKLAGDQQTPDGGGIPQFLGNPVLPRPMFSGSGDDNGGGGSGGGAGNTITARMFVVVDGIVSAETVTVSTP